MTSVSQVGNRPVRPFLGKIRHGMDETAIKCSEYANQSITTSRVRFIAREIYRILHPASYYFLV